MSVVDKLLEISTPGLAPPLEANSAVARALETLAAGSGLCELLSQRNGFVAFYGALQVYPIGQSAQGLHDIQWWNQPELWRDHYEELIQAEVFFAEDLFGGQFALKDGTVCSFDPETAEFEAMGANIEEWAQILLTDWNYFTGASLAKEWQEQHGALSFDQRLLPRIPFNLEGEFHIDNLIICDRVTAMRARGALALQNF